MNNDFIASNNKIALVFKQLYSQIKRGTKLIDLEKRAWQLIKEQGGEANFAQVPDYQWATCININAGIVHGIPNDYIIQPDDLVSLDMGMLYNKWHSDMAYTKYCSDKPNSKIVAFLNAGKKALKKAVSVVKPGNRVGHISKQIQTVIEGSGYSVVFGLTGHGVGRQLHQLPNIPGILTKAIDKTAQLKPGMGLAIEVIYSQGNGRMMQQDDGWTITTQDGKISALFEQTVLVTQKGHQIVTPYLFS